MPSLNPLSPGQIDDLVAVAMERDGIPGMGLAIVAPDRPLHVAGYGVKELGTDRAVGPDTLFAIASVTKAFTSCCMAMLVDEGRMGWDDPVRLHLPWFRLSDPLADANVTLRDLVSHRTGLSRHDMLWYKSPWTREEVVRSCGHVALSAQFREKYQYNNNMFAAAGLAVAAAAGVDSWETFIHQRIFGPLDMSRANCTSRVASVAPDRAEPHRRPKGVTTGPVRRIPWLEFDAEGPGGTINATPHEMGRWLRFQLNDGELDGRRLVSSTALRETYLPNTVIRPEPTEAELLRATGTTQQTYAMGWTIWDYRGHRVRSHGGAIDGFRSNVIVVPDAGLAIGVFVNKGPTRTHEALRNHLLDRYLGLEPRDWDGLHESAMEAAEQQEAAKKAARQATRHAETRPSRPLEAYVGEFTHPAYRTARVALEGEGLVIYWSKLRLALDHWHYDVFDAHDDPEEVETEVRFTLGPTGEVDRLWLYDQEFRREASSS